MASIETLVIFQASTITTNLGSSEAEWYLVEPNGGDVIIGSVFLEIFLNQKVGFFVVYVLTMNKLFIHTSDKILLKILQAVCFVFFQVSQDVICLLIEIMLWQSTNTYTYTLYYSELSSRSFASVHASIHPYILIHEIHTYRIIYIHLHREIYIYTYIYTYIYVN
jgi:hypothetical protein